MWKRNLLFAAVIPAGMLLLGAALFPPTVPPLARHFNADQFDADDFRVALFQVNAAVRKGWTDAAVQPSAPAPELAVARRLSLGLMGRIPSLQEVRQFEAVEEPRRLQVFLTGILEDRRCADYLAERLARAFVGTEDGPFILFRRRRFVLWLSDELMKNRPYDELVRELIASDGLWTDSPATNFVTVTGDPAKQNQPDPERLAGRVTRAFLGIRLDCAQCHNHPFEKWRQADFRGLAAYFGQVQSGFTGIHEGDGELKLPPKRGGDPETVMPRVPFRPELLSSEGNRRQQLAGWITHPGNPYFARATVNRIWALLLGRPLVSPVDEISAAEQPPPVLQVLADDFVAHRYDLRRLVRLIASTEAFQIDSTASHPIAEEHENAWAAFPLTRLRPEQVVGSVFQAASLESIKGDSPVWVKLIAFTGEREFVHRYGDTGEDEFGERGGTIPQRLLLMNGDLVHSKTKDEIFNAAARIGWMAKDDPTAVRSAYLAVLTRVPTAEEAAHFEQRLAGTKGKERGQRMEDLYWALINSTEFSWNH